MTKPDPEMVDTGPPLSPQQTRHVALDTADPDRRVAPIASRWDIRGDVPTDALETALREVVEGHAILRTQFIRRGGAWTQRVRNHAALKLDLVDIRTLPIDDHAGRIDAIARGTAAAPFDLGRLPLLRVTHVRTGPQSAALLFAGHPAVVDPASIDLICAEMGARLAAMFGGGPSERPKAPFTYADYARWQQAYRASTSGRDDLAFWARTLAGAERFRLCDIPSAGDTPPPGTDTPPGATRLRVPQPDGFAAWIKQGARRLGVRPYMLGVTATFAALALRARHSDLLLGARIRGRSDADLKDIVGPFASLLPLRAQMRAKDTLGTLLADLRTVVAEARAHKACSEADIVASLVPDRLATPAAFSDVTFDLRDLDDEVSADGFVRLTPAVPPLARSVEGLDIAFVGRAAQWELVVDYDDARVSDTFVTALCGDLFAALAALIEAPETRLADVPRIAVPPGISSLPLDDRPHRRGGYSFPPANQPRSPSGLGRLVTFKAGDPDGPVILVLAAPGLAEGLSRHVREDRTVVSLSPRSQGANSVLGAGDGATDLDHALNVVASAFRGRPLALVGTGAYGETALHLAPALAARGHGVACTALVDVQPPASLETALRGPERVWRPLRGRLSRMARETSHRLGGAAGPSPSPRSEAMADGVPRQSLFASWPGEVILFSNIPARRPRLWGLAVPFGHGSAGPVSAGHVVAGRLSAGPSTAGQTAPEATIVYVPGSAGDIPTEPAAARMAEIVDARIERALRRLPV